MTIVTRFAPSPTGRLHLGNLRAALHNYLLARKAGGRFLLRLDDTDAARSTEAFADAIRADLRWLGLSWDGEARQSDRAALYEAAFDRLRAAGRVYPAYESQQELDLKRKVLRGRGLPPIYDRAALALDDDARARLEADGVSPHWRFRLDHDAPIAWEDGVRGPQQLDPRLHSDPIVRRADGSWLYLLPSVIDDIDLHVTDVVRGEDHVTNTGLQIQMFEALAAASPRFAHAALLTGKEGKLSKRLGSLGVDHFREVGIEPEALAALLARIGTSDPVVPVTDVDDLAEGTDPARFGRAPARFDETELAQVNARTIHIMPYDQIVDRLPAGMEATAWEAVRPNLSTLAEAGDWWGVIEGPIPREIAPENADFIAEAAKIAREMAWIDDPWHDLTGKLKEKTGRNGKMLFLPLRLALTGRPSGPDMAALLPLIGRERAIARLDPAAG